MRIDAASGTSRYQLENPPTAQTSASATEAQARSVPRETRAADAIAST